MKKLLELRQEAKDYIADNLPTHMHGIVVDYFEHGLHPGDFLTAILSNDLVGAVNHADHINKERLPEYVQFLYWHVPGRGVGSPWGSRANVETWVRRGYEMRQEEPEVAT